MVLQRLFGLSDREAVEAFTFDARWKYACGGLVFDHPGFAHTVLVDMRARLDASDDKRRIFNVTVQAAGAAGLVGAKRVLDSTPLYDAVATMDTITLIRSAIRGLLRVADDGLEGELRAVLASGDDYASAAKPQIDWDDAEARDALVDSRARDAFACLAVLDGRELGPEVGDAAELLATVVGQDLEETDDACLRIARRVAKDRVISTVDPEARHGHKTSARGFDGYKGHVAVDPDSEVITDTVVSAGNAGDAGVAEDLIDDLLADDEAERRRVYGDAAYGTGEFLDHLAEADIDSRCKTQPPASRPRRIVRVLRRALHHLSAASRVHQRRRWAHHPRRSTNNASLTLARNSRILTGSTTIGRPAQSRTQARSPHAPPPRRTTSTRSRQT